MIYLHKLLKVKDITFSVHARDSISILPIANITAKSIVQLFQKQIEKKNYFISSQPIFPNGA